MNNEFIFVTGYFGAPIRETAEKIAAEKNYNLLFLDDEIEKSDGRTVLRICMMMGEHEYRNKEYEILSQLTSGNISDNNTACNSDFISTGTVVCCGDGVLHDEMSRDIILKHTLLIAGLDMSLDELWKNAVSSANSPHAFMHFGTEEDKRKAFEELYKRQKLLFSSGSGQA